MKRGQVIVETRHMSQFPAARRVGKPRGILNQKAGEKRFSLSLHPPSHELGFFVEHYWIVRWDLRGREPYLQETLPYPCVHLVIERGRSRIVGVVREKFSYLLTAKGFVFGVKFRPGAFYPFVKSPVSGLTDTTVELRDVFGTEGQALEEAVLSREDEGEMIELTEAFIRDRLPERDENVATINRIVEYIAADREITRVEDLAGRFNLSKRTLQRIFKRYVGVSPKWVIRRYRLHEAAERLANGEAVDWPNMALDLGYFDQAHFIRDFKAIVGTSPAAYAKSIGSEV